VRFPAAELFDLGRSLSGPFLEALACPWEILPRIADVIAQVARELPAGYLEKFPGVWVGPETLIEPSALIRGPAIIGARCEIRHGALLRGIAIIGDGCVVGNSTEIKNAILFDGVQAPHFNYVGDSVLGFRSHLGAGAILSNVRLDGRTVRVLDKDGPLDTGLPKFGAILGDSVEVGCNSVVNPGTVIGRQSLVHPLVNVGGVVPPRSVVRRDGSVTARRL